MSFALLLRRNLFCHTHPHTPSYVHAFASKCVKCVPPTLREYPTPCSPRSDGRFFFAFFEGTETNDSANVMTVFVLYEWHGTRGFFGPFLLWCFRKGLVHAVTVITIAVECVL